MSTNWQPMNTAPTDEPIDIATEVRLRYTDCWWDGDWQCESGCEDLTVPNPIAWMPIPKLPRKEDME